MTQRDQSPEERLLSLIKGKPARQGPPPAPQPASAGPAVPVAHTSEENPYLREFLKRYVPKNRFFEPAFLAMANKVLLGIVALLILYLIVELSWVKPSREIALPAQEGAARPSGAVPPAKEKAAAEKDYSYYSQAIAGKRIFDQSGGGASAAGQPLAVSSDEITANLGLVGIITGERPQAIIEDKKNQKVYYLGPGESFDGYTIEEIAEGKVIVERDGKRSALFL